MSNLPGNAPGPRNKPRDLCKVETCFVFVLFSGPFSHQLFPCKRLPFLLLLMFLSLCGPFCLLWFPRLASASGSGTLEVHQNVIGSNTHHHKHETTLDSFDLNIYRNSFRKGVWSLDHLLNLDCIAPHIRRRVNPSFQHVHNLKQHVSKIFVAHWQA